jgi:hypothetical protein
MQRAQVAFSQEAGKYWVGTASGHIYAFQGEKLVRACLPVCAHAAF